VVTKTCKFYMVKKIEVLTFAGVERVRDHRALRTQVRTDREVWVSGWVRRCVRVCVCVCLKIGRVWQI
jgi:hypothetical protein